MLFTFTKLQDLGIVRWAGRGNLTAVVRWASRVSGTDRRCLTAPLVHTEAVLQRQVTELKSRVAPLLPAADMRKLRKERDDLKNAVCNFETELLDIQLDTKVLAEDRDNFKLLYEQVSLVGHCMKPFLRTRDNFNSRVSYIVWLVIFTFIGE